MPQTNARRSRRPVELRVLRTEWRTPHMVRVVLGGAGIADFRDNEDTDHYVKLLFPRPGVNYPEPFDLEAVERDLPRSQWPVRRTYTVRHFDAGLGELTVDFVYHGDEGIAGPWAAAARPGDVLRLMGPGGKYRPSADADWHLLVGDEAAIPAIGSALDRMPTGARVAVILQVANPDEKQKFETPADADFTWVYRDDASDFRDQLADAVRAWEFPPGQGQFFVHGEAEAVMKRIRPYLLSERGVHRDWLSISGYWREGNSEESFREWKAAEATSKG
ncbi:MAG TPA: siderophore-interacting protein [Stackebrandtia sp.]|jgi:NADPH-dependent ferric siderophore reductase|uniref:siderophore-interacting protein n=1 Tax=Stackebrandtia sp. TaxID=2023065 RepID=UPI002D6C1FA3|nr:siderophore-interacting protein [Stackebrandtia sp.]HZE39110.1 siderophore-interacting protein [Stackebrandtia sp.]